MRYSNPEEKELSMCFNFHHLKVDYKDGNKWELRKADRRKLKDLFETWQTEMEKRNGWNAVFWCNHDQPRIVSRMGDEKRYWKESAKMFGTCIHLLRGTPYIFQGEELGMTNPGYETISQYRDVESIHYYEILLEEGMMCVKLQKMMLGAEAFSPSYDTEMAGENRSPAIFNMP